MTARLAERPMGATPRTEAMIDSCGDYEKAWHYRGRFADFARQLERENAALQRDADRYRWLRERGANNDHGLVACDIKNWSDEYSWLADIEVLDGGILDGYIDAALALARQA